VIQGDFVWLQDGDADAHKSFRSNLSQRLRLMEATRIRCPLRFPEGATQSNESPVVCISYGFLEMRLGEEARQNLPHRFDQGRPRDCFTPLEASNLVDAIRQLPVWNQGKAHSAGVELVRAITVIQELAGRREAEELEMANYLQEKAWLLLSLMNPATHWTVAMPRVRDSLETR
jgi:hypothetical protein